MSGRRSTSTIRESVPPDTIIGPSSASGGEGA